MTPSELEAFAHLKNNKIKAFKNGFPDFFCFKGKKFCFVEVKAGMDQVQKNQREFIEVLKRFNLPVFIIRRNMKGEWDGIEDVARFFNGDDYEVIIKDQKKKYRWWVPRTVAEHRWSMKNKA